MVTFRGHFDFLIFRLKFSCSRLLLQDICDKAKADRENSWDAFLCRRESTEQQPEQDHRHHATGGRGGGRAWALDHVKPFACDCLSLRALSSQSNSVCCFACELICLWFRSQKTMVSEPFSSSFGFRTPSYLISVQNQPTGVTYSNLPLCYLCPESCVRPFEVRGQAAFLNQFISLEADGLDDRRQIRALSCDPR